MPAPGLVGCLLLIWLAGCQGPDSAISPEPPDGAPLRAVTAADVPDAEPWPEPILAAGNSSPYVVNGVEYRVLPSAAGYLAEGVASWYGTRFHGRRTSNGEIYDLYLPTAAHRSLPIPSYARVTNLANGRSMILRINDRGPFHDDRLIDLSYAAAVRLGFAEEGTAPVRVEALTLAGTDDRRAALGYRYLQLGAFASAAAARELRDAAAGLVDVPVTITAVALPGGDLHRVRMGPARDIDHLERLQALLRDRGIDPGQPLP